MWSRDYPGCTQCQTTEIKHMAKGLCARCYQSQYRPANADRIASLKRDWYESFVQGTDRQKIAREQRNFGGKRDAILLRDGYKCVRCGSRESLTVHHRDREGRGKTSPNNDESNLETLCRKCHIEEHRQELMDVRADNGFKRGPNKKGVSKQNAVR